VLAVLCFVDGLFPLFQRRLRVGTTSVVSPRALPDLVAAPGPMTDDERYQLYCVIEERLPGMA